MDDNHTVFRDNLAAYALGALDEGEVSALEAHLQTCETCRAELADYQRVSSGLLGALPLRPPQAAARRSLQRRLTSPASRVRPAFQWSLGGAIFGGLLAVLIGLNLLTVWQLYAVRQEQAEMNARGMSEQTAIAMLAYPTTKTLAFAENGVSGSLLVDKTRNLVAVFAWNLATPPAGKAYQMWLIDAQGKRTDGGLLVQEDGYPFVMAVIRVSQPLTNFNGVGVTLEPAGGSPQPTGPRVFRVDF
jgi:anti-sigma-K factor RskA